MSKVEIFLVEDHPIFRLGLQDLIEQEAGFHVCGEAKSVGSAWNKIRVDLPDLVIIDISLVGRNGLELTKLLKNEYPELPTLMLSMHEETLYAERALQAGARGYIMKHETADLIIDAIHVVRSGKVYLSPKMTSEVLHKIVGGSNKGLLPQQCLTNRELEVFEMIGSGLSTREVSERLCLSVKTIGTYRERIKAKLTLRNSSELSYRAVQWIEQRGDRGSED
ncbi:MAG: response regulator transcription factor [Desulfuromusa sp.]|nr:response regulator transcription factor [Desulfuromusa sp.]